jgi:hypothetical protein
MPRCHSLSPRGDAGGVGADARAGRGEGAWRTRVVPFPTTPPDAWMGSQVEARTSRHGFLVQRSANLSGDIRFDRSASFCE